MDADIRQNRFKGKSKFLTRDHAGTPQNFH